MNKEQKEILSLLPESIIKSKDFSKKAKLVLAYLIYYNDSEFAKTNGFFYKTNSELMNDSGLSNKGIGIVLNRFSDLGFISRNVGKYKGNASEYRLNLSAIQNFPKGEVKGEVSIPKGEVKGEVSIPKGEVKGEVSKFTLSESQYNDLLLSIHAMKQKISDLENEISKLKGEVKSEPFSKGEVSKFTTDTDTDTVTRTIESYTKEYKNTTIVPVVTSTCSEKNKNRSNSLFLSDKQVEDMVKHLDNLQATDQKQYSKYLKQYQAIVNEKASESQKDFWMLNCYPLEEL